jgi:hypothetical protein
MAHSTMHLTHVLTSHQRRHTVDLPQAPIDEELARDWTLSAADREQVRGCRGDDSRLRFAIQFRVVRRYERFLDNYASVRAPILNFLSAQLDFPPPFRLWNPPAAKRPSRSMNAGSEGTAVSKLLTSRPKNKSSAAFVGKLPKGSVPLRFCLMRRKSV